jgi:hypothetical protein
MRRRPERSEFFEYYRGYVDLVPEGDITAILRAQVNESIALLDRVSEEQAAFRYAPGKWTLQEVVAHVVDLEWVFLARAVHFARSVAGELPGVEQDDMIAASSVGARQLPALLAQWRHLREAGVLFFEGLDDDAWGRTGVASGRTFSVRTFPYILAGHERHHMGVIREKYIR